LSIKRDLQTRPRKSKNGRVADYSVRSSLL